MAEIYFIGDSAPLRIIQDSLKLLGYCSYLILAKHTNDADMADELHSSFMQT
jgi:hypothetical protein